MGDTAFLQRLELGEETFEEHLQVLFKVHGEDGSWTVLLNGSFPLHLHD